MPKTNRKPGIHLHKTKKYTLRESKGTGIPGRLIHRHEYFWILIAKNGKTIAKSSETYKTKRAAVRSIGVAERLFAASTGLLGGRYYDHTGKDGVDILNYDYK